MKRALLIFIKNAEKGKVKTRLAATLGDEKALKIYRELLRHTREVVLSVEVARYLFYSSFLEKGDDCSEKDFIKSVQTGVDLGERIKNAFAKAFETHEKVVIIGSDCPTLTGEIISAAFDQLTHHDFVIGPAEDGGYYLLGMNVFLPEVFENIEWSTETVLAQTIENIEDMGKNYHLLPELADIDTEEDWEKYNRSAALHSRASRAKKHG